MATSDPRSRLIASAITLVRERGVQATGVAELTEHSGTARRSIYQHFPSGKFELIEASTRAAGRWVSRVISTVKADSPRQFLALIIHATSVNLVEGNFLLGCPIAAAALAPPEATGVRAAAAEVFESWTEQLGAALVESGCAEQEARSLAGFAISAVEGALMRCIASGSMEPLDQAAEHLARLLPETAAARP